ncbi:MAG: hypothetical protein U0074_00950 [Kouleothrix sp.]
MEAPGFAIICYFFRTPDSERAQWVAFYRDVTEQVRSEQQQRELQEQIIAAQDAALRDCLRRSSRLRMVW